MAQANPIERATELASVELADAEGVLQLVQRINIETQADYTGAAEALQDVKGKQKELETLRKEIVEPLNKSVKLINALFSKPLERLQAAERTIKAALLGYQERAQAREQAKLQAAVAASHAGNRAEAVALIASAAAEDTKVVGISTRDVYRFEITDATLIPREYLMIDESKIGAVVRGTKGTVAIPGVKVICEKSMTARAS